MTRVYSGSRQHDGTTLVRVNGRPLDARPNFRNQSVTTFDWATRVVGVRRNSPWPSSPITSQMTKGSDGTTRISRGT